MGEIAVNTAIHDFTDALAQENCDLLGLDYETLGHREWLRKGTTHIPSTAANVLAGRSHDLAFLNGALVTKAKQLQAKASANELIMELVAERRLLKPWLIAARFEGIRILA